MAKSWILGLSAMVICACGGKAPDAKVPEPGTSAPSGTSASPTAEPSSSPPTTTTATLAGNDPGTKLPPAGSATGAPKGDDPPKKGAEPGRGREDIQAIIVARRDEARACYDEGLKKNPGIEGDLDIKWTIDPEGNVTDAGADASRSTIRDDAVAACIVAIIKKVKFAKSAKGFETKTHYPFNFHPKAGQVGKGGQPSGGAPKN
jgi:hypothetical protein